MNLLRWAVLTAGVISLAVLILRARWAAAFGRPESYAPARGSARRGIIYALGRGLLPWEKESARLHLATYVAGILYHAGLFGAFAILSAQAADIAMPRPVAFLLRIDLALGLFSGIGLLIKRAARSLSRFLSRCDDYAANLIVDLFLAFALAASLDARAEVPFMAISVILLIYIPLGKIRHCLFFFRSRIGFGRLLGRRGVLPPGRASAS